MFLIINVVRESSPWRMRSISSSYCFLFSDKFPLASLLLRLLTCSFGESNEAGIGIIEFLPWNIWKLCWREGIPMHVEGTEESTWFPLEWGKMFCEANSKRCNRELPEKAMLPREPGWRVVESAESPENTCAISQMEGFMVGAEPTWWCCKGIAGLIIGDGAVGIPCICCWCWGGMLSMNEGELDHIIGPGAWCW